MELDLHSGVYWHPISSYLFLPSVGIHQHHPSVYGHLAGGPSREAEIRPSFL